MTAGRLLAAISRAASPLLATSSVWPRPPRNCSSICRFRGLSSTRRIRSQGCLALGPVPFVGAGLALPTWLDGKGGAIAAAAAPPAGCRAATSALDVSDDGLRALGPLGAAEPIVICPPRAGGQPATGCRRAA